ncbi:hypothetical protein BT96DRAFT_984098 [Gymnopus androsaceus JB14]|uniref:Uncharacterized protein n=1 Tax=Gymnopus androsaceus JB14 TaxID=1447944 RepID=A0A6A4IR10_9AGAR|nr:hypothetical protein BT96DRAFT_984098 [Gymnopus androsaceus JB14]
MQLAYSKNTSGLPGIQHLNDKVIQQPNFDPKDLRGLNTTRVSVKEKKAVELEVSGVVHQDLLSVLKEAYMDESASEFNLRGFKQMWQCKKGSEPIRVHGEVYTSNAFLDMEREVLASPPEPGCDLEQVVAPIMAYSDSTHLASFGTASLWPGYLWFGSQSKYSCAKPSKLAAHHLVYFPSLPETLEDEYKQHFGSAPTDSIKTHLKRELNHEIWKVLLTPEFLDAYVHGVVVECADGILRRLYPWFFTYSADYPEKVLLASIKNMGTHLCPRKARRKLVEKARKKFFKHGKPINGTVVEDLLRPDSSTAIWNAFSEAFEELGFNYFQLFVVDLMHEVELGVFKDLFTHLIQMCHAMGKDTVQELNERFRKIPTFGRSTIRWFVNNVSEMKKLGARDFEDLL